MVDGLVKPISTARNSGQEFVHVLAGADLDEASGQAEKVRF